MAVRGGIFCSCPVLRQSICNPVSACWGRRRARPGRSDQPQALLEAAGSSLDKVVKVNVLLHSMLEAPNMNDVYVRFFPDPPPARTVCGARLPDGVKVIIECTALA